MIASALGLDLKRGDNINVTSMPFMVESNDLMLAAEDMPGNLLYEYLPLVKFGLLSLGVFIFYFLLVRPIIKTMKSEAIDHNQSVTELEKAVQEVKAAKEKLARKAEKADEPIEVVLDAVTILRNEVMRNHVPTAYIIKNWINEG